MGPKSFQPLLASFGALLFPGLGHLILGKWIRSILFAFAILLLFYLGLNLEGRLHSPASEQFIELLLFGANLSNGIPYFLATYWGYGVGNLENQSFDYGTTYLAVSGLLNILASINAYDIAVGRKN